MFIEIVKSITNKKSSGSSWEMIPKLMKMSTSAANFTMNHPDFRRVMETDSFDLLISGFFLNNFQIGLGAHFKCPVAILITGPGMLWTHMYLGQPVHPEAVPNLFSGITGKMNLKDRLTNIYYTIKEYFLTRQIESFQENLYQ